MAIREEDGWHFVPAVFCAGGRSSSNVERGMKASAQVRMTRWTARDRVRSAVG
ncbi:hypothetical protein [Porcincola intestinalis]|uniref:hypothetical protein n=1 Tax=Porcincola intestinalis TaxID=2606632 RepID=UPI002A911B94|nr:hypothetical protein [Porcincola intestinalis]